MCNRCTRFGSLNIEVFYLYFGVLQLANRYSVFSFTRALSFRLRPFRLRYRFGGRTGSECTPHTGSQKPLQIEASLLFSPQTLHDAWPLAPTCEVSPFLSISPFGCCYIWFTNQRGRRKKVSTRCKRKVDALRFLQDFREEDHERQGEARQVCLSTFFHDYLKYAEANLARRTLNIHRYALRRFQALVGDIPLTSVSPFHFDSYRTFRFGMTNGRWSRTSHP